MFVYLKCMECAKLFAYRALQEPYFRNSSLVYLTYERERGFTPLFFFLYAPSCPYARVCGDFSPPAVSGPVYHVIPYDWY
jgi:hypothetical protein